MAILDVVVEIINNSIYSLFFMYINTNLFVHLIFIISKKSKSFVRYTSTPMTSAFHSNV